MLRPLATKPPRSRDSSLNPESEEKESKRRIKLKDGKDLSLFPKNTRKSMMLGPARTEPLLMRTRSTAKPLNPQISQLK